MVVLAIGCEYCFLLAKNAFAQKVGEIFDQDSVTNRPLLLLTALAGLAIVPFALMMVTSFVKIAVVLSIVRQAIGTQQIPPTQVITGLAIVLTVYIMMPVGLEIYHNAQESILQDKATGQELKLTDLSVDQIVELADEAQGPMRGFLMKHAHLKRPRHVLQACLAHAHAQGQGHPDGQGLEYHYPRLRHQ